MNTVTSNELQGKIKKSYRPVVKLKIPQKWADRIFLAKGIIFAFTGNAYITAPSPTILVVNGHVLQLDAAEAKVKTRVIGSAAERDVKWEVVLLDLYAWKALVQLIADGDFVNSIAIIESAGFAVRCAPLREKPTLKVEKGSAPGTAKLIAKSLGKRIAYDWGISEDGQNWRIIDGSTNCAKKDVTDLKAACIYFFRVRGNTSVTGAWSDPVAFIRL